MKNEDSLTITISTKISKRQEDKYKVLEELTGIKFRKFLYLAIDPLVAILTDMFNEGGRNKEAFQKALLSRARFEIGGHNYGVLIRAMPKEEVDDFINSLAKEFLKNKEKRKNETK
jgi:hypothetical protein